MNANNVAFWVITVPVGVCWIVLSVRYVRANRQWFTRLVVASALAARLEGLDLAYPRVGPDMQKQLKAARQALANE